MSQLEETSGTASRSELARFILPLILRPRNTTEDHTTLDAIPNSLVRPFDLLHE